jgi:hypothetical protein
MTRKPYTWKVLNLPQITELLKAGKANFFVKHHQKQRLTLLVDKTTAKEIKTERRLLCHYDLELKRTENKVEYYEFA